MGTKRLYTIGYEGKTTEGLVAALTGNKVALIVDVRAVPNSRNNGFSKSGLSAVLSRNGIGYVHIRELGTPKYLRARLKANKDFAGFKNGYRRQLDFIPDVLKDLAEMVVNKDCCLLCLEEHYADCHRSILADEVVERFHLPLTIKHL
jgi:uncharacterized protein (DUF488 family)